MPLEALHFLRKKMEMCVGLLCFTVSINLGIFQKKKESGERFLLIK